MNYLYRHHDGRMGIGYSAWAAIVRALGTKEAWDLPEMEDPVWDYNTADDEWHKRADVFPRGETERIGELFESRD